MTLCLTFDDGLKTHAEIAAPALKQRGWSGAFCIPTGLMNPVARKLTPAQAEDMCLVGHEDNLMSWDDVWRMMADGHEVCPHTHDHADLAELFAAGKKDEIERQIARSRETFEKETGRSPAFFCTPHYSTCSFVNRRIRAHHMEVFNCGRANFGASYQKGQVTEFLEKRKKAGWLHVDISVHGITQATGGWEPFDSVEEFIGFLDEIKALEDRGLVRVVPYSVVHPKPSCISPLLVLWNRARNRASIKMSRFQIGRI